MQEESTRWQELDEAVKMKRKVKGTNAAECLYLIAVRNIYAGFSARMLTRAEAVEQKEQLVRECERYLRDIQVREKEYKAYQENILKAGSIRSQMVKEEDKDKSFLLALKTISAMTGEDTTEKIVCQKFGLDNYSEI